MSNYAGCTKYQYKPNEEDVPTIEFEGPMGSFWGPRDVSINALAKGAVEIVNELVERLGSPLDAITRIRAEGGQI